MFTTASFRVHIRGIRCYCRLTTTDEAGFSLGKYPAKAHFVVLCNKEFNYKTDWPPGWRWVGQSGGKLCAGLYFLFSWRGFYAICCGRRRPGRKQAKGRSRELQRTRPIPRYRARSSKSSRSEEKRSRTIE